MKLKLLGIQYESIGQFEVTNPEMPPEFMGGKFCRLDTNMTWKRCSSSSRIRKRGGIYMTAIEQQTIDIMTRLNDSNKSFLLDFAKFIEQRQFGEKKARNAAYLDKIQRGINQCAEGHGLIRDIIEEPNDE